MTHGKSRSRYFVTYPGVPEQEVSFEDWCSAERAGGFHGPEGRAATGGFSGRGISGRIEYQRISDAAIPGEPPGPRLHALLVTWDAITVLAVRRALALRIAEARDPAEQVQLSRALEDIKSSYTRSVAANLADFRSRPGVVQGECGDCGSDQALYDDAAGKSFCPACAWGAS